jgi:hypothetical protein
VRRVTCAHAHVVQIHNKSADYDPHHPGTVRRDSAYIYEEFLTTGGTDVKVSRKGSTRRLALGAVVASIRGW